MAKICALSMKYLTTYRNWSTPKNSRKKDGFEDVYYVLDVQLAHGGVFMDRMRLCTALAALLLLSSCGWDFSGLGGGTASAPSPAATTPEIVVALENSGALPKLDRSASLAGLDSNNDGIRDDIAIWIEQLPISAAQKLAISQLAKATQSALTVDTSNDTALRAVVAQQHAAVKCMVRRGADKVDGINIVTTLRNYTANTKDRVAAYLRFSNALDGSVLKSPPGDGCAQ